VINLTPIALAVREIFAGVRKYKSRSSKLGHVPFDLVICTPSKLLLVVDAHTKFEASSFSRSRYIGRCRPSWIRSLVGFDNSAAFRKPQSTYQLVKFECNLSRAAELERCYHFSNCRTLGAPIGQMDLRVGGSCCMGSAADERAQTTMLYYGFRFIFCPIFNQSAWNASGVEKRGEISHFLTHCEKQGRAGRGIYTNYS